jgi:hypothetical protein
VAKAYEDQTHWRLRCEQLEAALREIAGGCSGIMSAQEYAASWLTEFPPQSETPGEPALKPPLPGHTQNCICAKCMAYYAPKTEAVKK